MKEPEKKPPLAPDLNVRSDEELISLRSEADSVLESRKKARLKLFWAEDEIRVKKLRETYQSGSAKEMILALFDHSRTSCGDENLANGFGSGENINSFRCAKCALIEFLEWHDVIGSVVNVRVEIDVTKPQV